MARMRVFLVLLLALTAGGALAFGTYNYVSSSSQGSTASAIPSKPVVVAASDLPLGAELTADDIKVIEWPASAVPAAARPVVRRNWRRFKAAKEREGENFFCGMQSNYQSPAAMAMK